MDKNTSDLVALAYNLYIIVPIIVILLIVWYIDSDSIFGRMREKRRIRNNPMNLKKNKGIVLIPVVKSIFIVMCVIMYCGVCYHDYEHRQQTKDGLYNDVCIKNHR